jgi:HEPN domain-containing protein
MTKSPYKAMSYEEVEVLKERAFSFLKEAKRLADEGEWDLSVFCLEQYCQLYVNYKLLIKTGGYTRTHSIRELLLKLADFDERINKMLKDENNLLLITKLEDSHIVARYLPRRYTKEEVIPLIRFVEEVFRKNVERV